MKIYLAFLLLGLCAASPRTQAQEPSAQPVPPQAQPETRKLPFGAGEVLRLSQAQVSDDVIVSYVQSSGTVYNLEAPDIVYLKSQGVSDRVVNAMIDQRKRANEVAAAQQTQAATTQQQQAYTTATTAPLTPMASSYAPASSVYVIPYPQATYAYYGYPYYYRYPYYYGGYYGYRYPYYGYYGGSAFSFRFGYGGHGWGHGGFGHGLHGGFGHGGHGGHGGHR